MDAPWPLAPRRGTPLLLLAITLATAATPERLAAQTGAGHADTAAVAPLARPPELYVRFPGQPERWGEAVAAPKRALRIEGSVYSRDGVAQIRAYRSGRFALVADPPGNTRFVGFLPPPDSGEGSRRVEITAIGRNGLSATQSYEIQLSDSIPPPTAFGEFSDASTRRRRALVIGISDYASERLVDLPSAAANARELALFLRSEAAGLGGWRDEDVVLLVDSVATRSAIRAALARLAGESSPDDVLLLFFAGHGLAWATADPSLMAYDSDPRQAESTGVPLTFVRDILRDAPAYQKIVIAEASRFPIPGAHHQHAFRDTPNVTRHLPEALEPGLSGLLVLVDSPGWTGTWEGDTNEGVFTRELLEGLRGRADIDADGIVTLDELAWHTRDRVRRATRNGLVPLISDTSYDFFWPMAEVR